MKCIHCGMPLESTRTQVNCPRCGMSTTPGQESMESSGSQGLIPAHQVQVEYAHGEHTLDSSAGDLQAGQAALPRTQSPVPATTTWEPSSTNLPQSTPPSQTKPAWQYDSEHLSNRPRMEPRKRKRPGTSSNIGVVVAGLCVFTSALILIFVYFMATGLSNDAPGKKSVISPAKRSHTMNLRSLPTLTGLFTSMKSTRRREQAPYTFTGQVQLHVPTNCWPRRLISA